MNVHLDDSTSLAVRLLAIRVGMSADDVIRVAVASFLRQHDGA